MAIQKIAIIGAGQSGLQLGFELLSKGFDVTLYSEKTSEEIFNSSPPPVPIQFAPSVNYEVELDLNFWHSYPAKNIDGVRFDLYAPDRTKAFTIEAPLATKAQTIDLRLKFSVWLEAFTKRGGNLIIQQGSIELLESAAKTHDAVFVATGKGELANLFEKDRQKSVFNQPQRKTALFYARNCRLNYKNDPASGGSSYTIMQGLGELIMSPFLSKDKERIFYVLLEALPGSALDFFDSKEHAEEQYVKTKRFMQSNFPSLYEMIKDSTLVNNEWLCGSIIPYVKKPVGKLPSGKVVMAIGDLLILNDPIMAQGLNGASKLARHVSKAVEASTNATFSENWIIHVFNEYWETAQYNNQLTSTMLKGPERHQQQLLFAASQNSKIADALVNGIGNAYTLWPWFGDAQEAEKFISIHTRRDSR